jgi:hypothetical protein
MSFKRQAVFALLITFGLLSRAPEVLGAQEPDLNLSDLYRESAAGSTPASSKKAEGIAGALEILLNGRTLPIPCATSLIQEARRHPAALGESAAEALRVLGQRPALDHDGTRPTRDGQSTIHYSLDPLSSNAVRGTDRDFNGIPDIVDQVEDALERSQQTITSQLGWPPLASGQRGERYDVYLIDLGGAGQGLTVSDRDIPSTPRDDSLSHIILDVHLDGEALYSAVAHQVAHASLLGLSSRVPAWWSEATAAWLEIQVTGDLSGHAGALAKRLERMDSSLASDSLMLSMGNSLWASFLADRREGHGEEIRQIWLETSLRSGEPILPLMDEVLRRLDLGTLSEAFRDYTRWCLFTSTRDDGDHFRLGSLYPPLIPRTSHHGAPAESNGLESVDPLGAAIIRFEGDGSRGGLKLRFDADVPSQLQVDLIITPIGKPRPHLVELDLDDRGHGEVGVPWRGVREAILIVRNPGLGGAPARFRYATQMDPLYPFDLASFSAVPSPAGITLQWETAREIDVLGWNVYRSSSPSDAFQRVNPVTLPSGADSLEDTDYLYQDSSVQPGRRYYYLVEAITLAGLPERSIILSARAADGKNRP